MTVNRLPNAAITQPKPAATTGAAKPASTPTTTTTNTAATQAPQTAQQKLFATGETLERAGQDHLKAAKTAQNAAVDSLNKAKERAVDPNGVFRRSAQLDVQVAQAQVTQHGASQNLARTQVAFGQAAQDVATKPNVKASDFQALGRAERRMDTAEAKVTDAKANVTRLSSEADKARFSEIQAGVNDLKGRVNVSGAQKEYRAAATEYRQFSDSLVGRTPTREEKLQLGELGTRKDAAFKELTFQKEKQELVRVGRDILAGSKDGKVSQERGQAFDTQFRKAMGAQGEADAMKVTAQEARNKLVNHQAAAGRTPDMGELMRMLSEQGNRPGQSMYGFGQEARHNAYDMLPYMMQQQGGMDPMMNFQGYRPMGDMMRALTSVAGLGLGVGAFSFLSELTQMHNPMFQYSNSLPYDFSGMGPWG